MFMQVPALSIQQGLLLVDSSHHLAGSIQHKHKNGEERQASPSVETFAVHFQNHHSGYDLKPVGSNAVHASDPSQSHAGDFSKVCILGGSEKMHGFRVPHQPAMSGSLAQVDTL